MNLLVLQPGRGTISIGQRTMLQKLGALLLKAGGHLSFSDDTTSGMLGHSRGILLHRLARSGCHRGLWLDTDTTLDPARVLEMAARSEDVIMWNYPIRVAFDIQYPPEHAKATADLLKMQAMRLWTGQPKMADGAPVYSDDGNLVEMTQAGFGACLMSPAAARLAVERYGTTRDWNGSPLALAFDPPPQPYGRSSEDIAFWRRYTQAGGRFWCDPRPYVTNGQTGGCYADEIRKAERLGQAIAMALAGAA